MSVQIKKNSTEIRSIAKRVKFHGNTATCWRIAIRWPSALIPMRYFMLILTETATENEMQRWISFPSPPSVTQRKRSSSQTFNYLPQCNVFELQERRLWPESEKTGSSTVCYALKFNDPWSDQRAIRGFVRREARLRADPRRKKPRERPLSRTGTNV